MGEREHREYRMYGFFTHPIRAKMMELLSDRGPLSFTDLRKEIPGSVGTFYYHISVLGELLGQDDNKRYFLTDLGFSALKHQKSHPLDVGTAESTVKLPILERVAPIISGSWLLQGVSLSPLRHIVEAALILILGSWIISLSGLNPRLFFLLGTTTPSSTSAIIFFMGWIAIYSISDIIATLVFKSRGGHLSLLVGSTYSLLPLTLFALIWLNQKTYPLLLLGSFEGWPLRILFFVLQAWSLLLLSSSIRISKRIDASKAIIIVLLLLYLNVTFILLGNIP